MAVPGYAVEDVIREQSGPSLILCTRGLGVYIKAAAERDIVDPRAQLDTVGAGDSSWLA